MKRGALVLLVSAVLWPDLAQAEFTTAKELAKARNLNGRLRGALLGRERSTIEVDFNRGDTRVKFKPVVSIAPNRGALYRDIWKDTEPGAREGALHYHGRQSPEVQRALALIKGDNLAEITKTQFTVLRQTAWDFHIGKPIKRSPLERPEVISHHTVYKITTTDGEVALMHLRSRGTKAKHNAPVAVEESGMGVTFTRIIPKVGVDTRVELLGSGREAAASFFEYVGQEIEHGIHDNGYGAL